MTTDNNPQTTGIPDSTDRSLQNDTRHQERLEQRFRENMKKASDLLTRGNGQAAIPLLERCLELHPDDVNVLGNLGGAFILAGQHRYAVPLLERAVELAPDNPALWANLAAAYLGKLVTSRGEGQTKALNAYARVVALDAAFPNVHYNMGLIHIDRREWDEAQAAFMRALHTDPSDEDAQTMLDKIAEIRSRPPDPKNN